MNTKFPKIDLATYFQFVVTALVWSALTAFYLTFCLPVALENNNFGFLALFTLNVAIIGLAVNHTAKKLYATI